MAFRVGQKVVCVDSGTGGQLGCRFGPSEAPKVGEIYTIRRMLIEDDGEQVLHLCEISRDAMSRLIWGDDAGYWSRRFRPIATTNTGMAILEQIRRDVTNKTALPIKEDEQV